MVEKYGQYGYSANGTGILDGIPFGSSGNQMWLAGQIPHIGKVLGGKPCRNARELPRLIPFDDWNIYTHICAYTHTHT